MKKVIRREIRRADKIIVENDWMGVAYLHYGLLWRPTSRNAWRISDRRAIKAAAKDAVKAFAKNADGTFRRCAKVRAEARMRLARVIFERADICMGVMLEGDNAD